MGWIRNVKMSCRRVFREEGDGLAQSRRNLFSGNVMQLLVTYLTTGTLYTTLLLVLFRGESESLRNEYIGNIAMLQTAAGFLQMLAPLILERLRTRKVYIITVYSIYYALDIVGLAAVPILPFDIITKANIFMVICGLKAVANALASPGLQAWQIYPVPTSLRSDFFALKNMSKEIISNVTGVLAGVLLELAAINENEYIIIVGVRAVSLVLAVLFLRKWYQVKEPVYITGEKRPSVGEILTVPFRYPRYLINTLIAAVWTMASLAANDFYSAYALSEGGVSYSQISLTFLIGVPLSLIATPLWNQLARKIGLMYLMPFGMLLYAFTFAFNGLVVPETRLFYMCGSLWCCVMAPSLLLGMNNLMYDSLPKEGQSSCLAFYSTAGTVLSFAGAWLGKTFMKITDGKILSIFGLDLPNGAYISFLPFGIMALLSVVSYFVYRKQRVVCPKETAAAVSSENKE